MRFTQASYEGIHLESTHLKLSSIPVRSRSHYLPGMAPSSEACNQTTCKRRADTTAADPFMEGIQANTSVGTVRWT